MSDFGEKLGPKKQKAILALLSSRNVEEAARVAGVEPRTLYRWMKEPEFDAAYRGARRDAYSQSIARIQQGSGAAATTLLKLAVDPATPASTRARAAIAVLALGAKGIELEDLEARVAELEQSVEASKKGKK